MIIVLILTKKKKIQTGQKEDKRREGKTWNWNGKMINKYNMIFLEQSFSWKKSKTFLNNSFWSGHS